MWLDLGQGDPVASVLMRREGRVSGEGEGGERSHETTEPEAAEIQPQAVNITGSGKTPGGPSPRSWRVWSCDTLSPAV